MQQTQRPARFSAKTRAMSLLLALVLTLGLLPGTRGLTGTALAHWADQYLDLLVEWGLIRPDQAENPDEPLTRADFMAITNRAYGYHEPGPTPFTDVKETDWFYDDVGIAYTAKYIRGTSPTTASPDETLTRETAATILGRNMMLQESPGELLDFTDARDISSWARGTVKSSLEHYLVNGYDDGTFKPQKDLSWGEMAAMLTRIVGTPLQEPGDYSLGGVFGNVTITSEGVTLRDSIISGDLYITGGVGLGNVKLENVTVLGRIIASGGGESEAGEATIIMRNVIADELLVDNLQDHFVTVQADGITEIGHTTVRTNAYLEDNTTEGLGLKNIDLEGEEGTLLDLAGRIENVSVKTPGSLVQVAKGTVKKLTVDETAPGSTVTILRGAMVEELNLDVGTYVTGEGDIKKLNVNAPGCVVDILPEEIYIRPGITAVIAGEEMDSVGAEESSMDPMILAGYPVVSDIAPTSATALFSTNKKGTVYWAVSPISDGSVSTEDLIKPPSYGSVAVAHGNVAIPKGNEEVAVAITGLTAGGSYYLSAVLVDDRGQQSPTKVISFTTPDDSAPEFCAGYPYMSLITNNMAQVTVMPTKSCKLYYALLPTGAVAPTEEELRSAAVIGNLGYGVRDVTKNTEDVFQVNDQTLEEQKTYDLYLWLVDANGANKGEIVKLTFTTVDKTPPIFDPPPTVTTVQATSVGLTFQLNEDGTVYWVVVPAGTDYPKPKPGQSTILLSDEYAKLQVQSGMNAFKSGNVKATAFKDGNFTVSGLEAETAYDLYYVAVDAAGNYSESVGKITINTLDTNGPKVQQYFTDYVGEDNTKRPTSDTDIILEFSEDVRSVAAGASGDGFLKLYQDYTTASGAAKTEALEKLVTALKGSIKLYMMDSGTGRPQLAPTKQDGDEDWVIDYEQVEIALKDGNLQVKFKSAGLKLGSGTTYYFEITDLTDNSNNQNAIVPGTVNYNTAESYGHNVPVIEIEFALVNFSSPGVGGSAAPYERDVSGSTPTITGTPATVDLSFRMAPQSTSSVDPTISYDVLLWSDTVVEYDLYYRILDSGNQVVTASTPEANRLPAKAGYGEVDPNGWVYLGASGAVNPSQGEWAGKSVNKHFNGCDGSNFPELRNLSEDLRYEFVITLKKIKTSADRSAWTGQVNFRAYVAAGWSNRLNSMTQGLSWNTWETFQKGGLAAGAKSIGMWNKDGSTLDYIELYQLFTNTSLPQFINGAPTFTPKDTSVTMRLTLDNPGTVYYAIGKANTVAGAAEEDWVPEITTTISSPANNRPVQGREDEYYILPSNVPRNGSGGVSAQPNLVLPDPQNIFDPTVWAEASGAFTGSVQYTGVANTPQEVTGLEPGTTYYVYYVIKSAAQDLSRVYIYQFRTDLLAKPKIELNPQSSGDVEMTTDVATSGYYRILTQANAMDQNMNSMLWKPFSEYAGTEAELGGNVPRDYLASSFTVLDALTTPYTPATAHAAAGGNDANCYFPTRDNSEQYFNRGYTVFDIYAGESARTKIYNMINTGRPGMGETVSSDINWGPFGTTNTPADWADYAIDLKNNPQISWDTPYVILTRAQDKSVGQVTDPAQVNSFSAVVFRKMSLAPPNVSDVMASMTASTNTNNTYSGRITFTFDSNVYQKSGHSNSLTQLTTGILAGVDPLGRGTYSVTSTTATSFTLSFSDVPAGEYLRIDGGRFFNSDSVEATEALVIRWLEGNGTVYLDVTWGPDKDGNDLKNWTNLSPVQTSGNVSDVSILFNGTPTLGGGFQNGYTLTLDNNQTSASVAATLNPALPTGSYLASWSVAPESGVVSLGSTSGLNNTITAEGIGEATVTLTVTTQSGTATQTSTQTINVSVTTDKVLLTESHSNDSTKSFTLTGTPTGKNWTVDWERQAPSPNARLTVSLDPWDTAREYNWTSSDNSVVSLASNTTNQKTVMMTAQKNGTATITVTVGSGASAVTRIIDVIVTGTDSTGANLNISTRS